MRLAPLVFALVLGCGGTRPPPTRAESAAVQSGPADPARRALAAVATTPQLVLFCGHAGEAAVRALAPTLPPCDDDDQRAGIVVAHVAAGTIVVVATRRTREGADPVDDVVAMLDGEPIDALPVSPPATPADGEALALAAIVLEHRGVVFIDAVSLRGALSGRARDYFEGLPLGVVDEGEGRHYAAIATERSEGATGPTRTVVRFEGHVDATGRTRVTRVPLAITSADGVTTIVPLENAPPVARTLRTMPVCGSPDEAAIRLRMPGLPACAPDLHDLYVAAGTTMGDLVVVIWAGQSGGARVALGSTTRGLSAALVPRTREDAPAIALAIALTAHFRGDLALDASAASALVGSTPFDRRVLARMGSDPIGFGQRGDATTLTAIGVNAGSGMNGPYRWVTRYDVTVPADGNWEATRRYLSHTEEGTETVQERPQPWPDEPIGGFEGL